MINTSKLWIQVHRFINKYIEVLDLVCDRYIQILHILKLRQFLDYLDCVGKVFNLFKCVCLREYCQVVDQEDTVLSSVTLNFVDCASVFVSTVKKSQQRPVYDRRSFSNAFLSRSWS